MLNIFKPTKFKIIISLSLSVIIYFILTNTHLSVVPCEKLKTSSEVSYIAEAPATDIETGVCGVIDLPELNLINSDAGAPTARATTTSYIVLILELLFIPYLITVLGYKILHKEKKITVIRV